MMSGAKSGVQARIREKQPKAIYTHCAGHSFNLAVLSSCSIPSIRNCIDQIKNLKKFFFFNLQSIIIMSGHGRTPLFNICVTRWVENIDGWCRILA